MNKGGFTLIELVMVIVIIGILAVVAVPRYFDLQDEATRAAEAGVVGGVRGGIYTFFAQNRDWPTALDTNTTDNLAFDIVLIDPVDAPGGTGNWDDAAAPDYTGPTGTIYTYNPANGSFR